MEGLITGSLEAGQAALQRGAWQEARAQFEAALAEEQTPAAFLGLGIAAAAQLDAATTLDAHERGYRLARSLGDDRSAARLALELAVDCLYFRGPAEAGGWLERASHLLEQVPLGEEHGMLTYIRASSALNGMHDPATARTLTAEGLAIARDIDYLPGEMLFLALDGLALVAERRDSGLGLQAQAAAIEAEAARRGWDLVAVLSDEGASGKSLNRPGLTEALGLVENGTAEIIIVSKLDRLTRSVHDFALMQRAQRRGWALVALDLVPFFACKEPSRGENGRNAQRPDS